MNRACRVQCACQLFRAFVLEFRSSKTGYVFFQLEAEQLKAKVSKAQQALRITKAPKLYSSSSTEYQVLVLAAPQTCAWDLVHREKGPSSMEFFSGMSCRVISPA